MKKIAELRGRHAGERAYIVGMGLSLLKLTPQHFGEGFIIALYEAIDKLESFRLPNSVYSMQKDSLTGLPTRYPLLVHAHESAKENPEYEPCYVFDNEDDFSREWWNESASTAVRIARLMGAANFTMLCFDFSMTGDRRRVERIHGELAIGGPDLCLIPIMAAVDEFVKPFGECVWVMPE